MSRRSRKSTVAVVGLLLLTGLAFMNWQAGRLEAASLSNGAPVMLVAPELIVEQTTPGDPHPGNGEAFSIIIGIRQTFRSQNTTQNVFQPVNPASFVLTRLEGSLDFAQNCHSDAQLPGKFVVCVFTPPSGSPAWAQGAGLLRFVLQLATAEGDVADAVVQLRLE